MPYRILNQIAAIPMGTSMESSITIKSYLLLLVFLGAAIWVALHYIGQFSKRERVREELGEVTDRIPFGLVELPNEAFARELDEIWGRLLALGAGAPRARGPGGGGDAELMREFLGADAGWEEAVAMVTFFKSIFQDKGDKEYAWEAFEDIFESAEEVTQSRWREAMWRIARAGPAERNEVAEQLLPLLDAVHSRVKARPVVATETLRIAEPPHRCGFQSGDRSTWLFASLYTATSAATS